MAKIELTWDHLPRQAIERKYPPFQVKTMENSSSNLLLCLIVKEKALLLVKII